MVKIVFQLVKLHELMHLAVQLQSNLFLSSGKFKYVRLEKFSPKQCTVGPF